MLLIVLLGVYIGRTVVAAPKQYRKTVQQQEVEPQIYKVAIDYVWKIHRRYSLFLWGPMSISYSTT